MNESTQYIVSCSMRKMLPPTITSTMASMLMSAAEAIIVAYFYGVVGMTVVTMFLVVKSLWACFYEGVGMATATQMAHLIGERRYSEARAMIAKSNMLLLLLLLPLVALGVGGILLVGVDSLEVSSQQRTDVMWYVVIKCITSLPVVYKEYFTFLLRTDSMPQLASIVTFATIAAQLLLDIVCMGLLDMGIKGAAVAELIAFTVALIAVVVARRPQTAITIAMRWPDRDHLKTVTPIALNAISDNIVDFVYCLVINSLVLINFGIETASIFFIFTYIVTINLSLSTSIGYALAPLLGVYHGEKNIDAMEYVARKGMIYALLPCCLLCGVVVCFPETVGITIFSYEYGQNIAQLCMALRIMAAGLLPAMAVNVMICVYQQTGSEHKAVWLSVVPAIISLLIIVAAALMKNDMLLWISLCVGDTLATLYIVVSSLNNHHRHRDSGLLTQTQRPTPHYRVEVNYMIRNGQFNEVEDYQEMAQLFITTQGISDNRRQKAGMCVEELLRLASLTPTEQRSYVCITLGITYDDEIEVNAKLDNDATDIQTLMSQQTNLEDDASLCMHMLKSIDPHMTCEYMLSITTINMRLTA